MNKKSEREIMDWLRKLNSEDSDGISGDIISLIEQKNATIRAEIMARRTAEVMSCENAEAYISEAVDALEYCATESGCCNCPRGWVGDYEICRQELIELIAIHTDREKQKKQKLEKELSIINNRNKELSKLYEDTKTELSKAKSIKIIDRFIAVWEAEAGNMCCSNCTYTLKKDAPLTAYCPSCGAQMQNENENRK